MATKNQSTDDNKKEGTRLPDSENPQLKSDYPLSEKDEVKQAETRFGKAVKKQDQKKNK